MTDAGTTLSAMKLTDMVIRYCTGSRETSQSPRSPRSLSPSLASATQITVAACMRNGEIVSFQQISTTQSARVVRDWLHESTDTMEMGKCESIHGQGKGWTPQTCRVCANPDRVERQTRKQIRKDWLLSFWHSALLCRVLIVFSFNLFMQPMISWLFDQQPTTLQDDALRRNGIR